jgi:hypothetical protein
MTQANPFADPETIATAPAVAQAPAPAPAPATPVTASVAPQNTTTDVDPFDSPAPQEPRGPRIRDLYGRLLLIVPKRLEESVPNRLQPGTTQDRMTADVIVLDGGPIAYGGRPEQVPPVPHDKTAAVPHKTANQYVSNRGLISQCRLALAAKATGGPGMVLGRLGVGKPGEDGQNAPYILSLPTDADKALARQYLASVQPFA